MGHHKTCVKRKVYSCHHSLGGNCPHKQPDFRVLDPRTPTKGAQIKQEEAIKNLGQSDSNQNSMELEL